MPGIHKRWKISFPLVLPIKEHLWGPACKNPFWWYVPRRHPYSRTNMGYWRPSIQFLYVLQSVPQLYKELPSCRILTEKSASGSTILPFLSVGYFSGEDPTHWQAVQKDSQACARSGLLCMRNIHFWKKFQEYSTPRVLEAPKPLKGRERLWLPSRLWYFIYVTEKSWKLKTWIAFITWVAITRSGAFPTPVFFTGVSVSMQNHKRCAEGKLVTEVPA